MATQKEIANRLRETRSQLDKIGSETETLLEKITVLEEKINAADADPELIEAFNEVKAAAQAVDDKVPDPADPATEGADVEKPGPDLESVNPHAQTPEERAAGAGPGSLPDLRAAVNSGEVQTPGVQPTDSTAEPVLAEDVDVDPNAPTRPAGQTEQELPGVEARP